MNERYHKKKKRQVEGGIITVLAAVGEMRENHRQSDMGGSLAL